MYFCLGRFISPIVGELSKKYPNVTTYKIDIDQVWNIIDSIMYVFEILTILWVKILEFGRPFFKFLLDYLKIHNSNL